MIDNHASDLSEDSEEPTKRDRTHPLARGKGHHLLKGSTTLAICQRFVEQGYSLTADTFTGLCAYLDVLLQWDCPIPTTAFDAFIKAYPEFGDIVVRDLQHQEEIGTKQQIPAYPSWFLDHKIKDHEPGIHLNEDSLGQIRHENQYTFRYKKERLELIAVMAWKKLKGSGKDSFYNVLRHDSSEALAQEVRFPVRVLFTCECFLFI
jgi:hypothetical protein